jgi:hypothetical protein
MSLGNGKLSRTFVDVQIGSMSRHSGSIRDDIASLKQQHRSIIGIMTIIPPAGITARENSAARNCRINPGYRSYDGCRTW